MKHKRRWSWTEKDLRKSRSYQHKTIWSGVPKWFRDHVSDRIEKSDHKKALHNFVHKGDDYLHIAPRTYKSSAKWYWW